MENKQKAENIIKNNFYLSLSTCSNNIPWIAPIYYIYDENFNFYFVSPLDSLHSQHIQKNKNVAFSIFDSTQEPGTGTGLQILGVCEQIGEKSAPKVVQDYILELGQFPIQLDSYGIYKISTKQFFIPNKESWENKGIDARVEVIFN